MATDDELEDISEDLVDPEIDAYLVDFGTPFTTNPPVVIIAASYWVASIVVQDRLSQINDESRLSRSLLASAQRIIKGIQSGEISIGQTTPLNPIMTDDPDDTEFENQSVFVGNEMDWLEREEEREEDD